MRAGRLDRLITIQRKSVTQDAYGQEIATWTALADRRAASVTPLRGEERFTAAQWMAKQQVEIRVRWSASIADLNPLDRIIYPALEVDVSPLDEPLEHEIYDIIEASEIGRREGFKISAARRAEVAP